MSSALLAATLTLTACGGGGVTETSETTTTTATTKATSATTVATATTEITGWESGGIPIVEGDTELKNAIVNCVDFDGTTISLEMTEDKSIGGYSATIYKGAARMTTGEYVSSSEYPEYFDIDRNIQTASERLEILPLNAPLSIKAGDLFGTLTVIEAQSSYYSSDGINGEWLCQKIILSGEATLDGYIVYDASSGDVAFIPKPDSELENGFPSAAGKADAYRSFIFREQSLGLYGNFQRLGLGNLNTDYHDNAAVTDVFVHLGQISEATVTLGSINLISDTRETHDASTAKILSITVKN